MPTVSMALLQGYLLRHKDDALSAVQQVSQLGSGEYSYRPLHTVTGKKAEAATPAAAGPRKPVQTRRVTRISGAEADRMFFNPQEGWDRDIK